MARVSIDLPVTFSFRTDILIYINHINYGHHLDNAALLSLVSEARVRFFNAFGYTELDVEGFGIVVADAAIQYRSEAYHGETLQFAMQAHDFNKYGFDLVYQVTDKATGREIARGKTGVVFFDYQAKKPVMVPEAFLKKVK
ncbi:MAG TPA: thioesterase family protein [Rhodospirillaceae bacterium]|nr:thioesterase family protein [Rhodospirillaceae bacterium]